MTLRPSQAQSRTTKSQTALSRTAASRRASPQTTPSPATRRSQSADSTVAPRDVGIGILMVLLGGGLLAALFHTSEYLGFDTLLVASKSLYNVIAGMHSIGIGIAQTLLGIIQMLGFAALAVVTIAAVLAIVSGTVRIGSHTLPRLSLVWNLLSHSLHLILQFLAVPMAGVREPIRARHTRTGATPQHSLRSGANQHNQAA